MAHKEDVPMKFNRMIAAVLLLCMALTFAACGAKDTAQVHVTTLDETVTYYADGH